MITGSGAQPGRQPGCFSWVLLYCQCLSDIHSWTPEVLTAVVPVVEKQGGPCSASAVIGAQCPQRIKSIKAAISLLFSVWDFYSTSCTAVLLHDIGLRGDKRFWWHKTHVLNVWQIAVTRLVWEFTVLWNRIFQQPVVCSGIYFKQVLWPPPHLT